MYELGATPIILENESGSVLAYCLKTGQAVELAVAVVADVQCWE